MQAPRRPSCVANRCASARCGGSRRPHSRACDSRGRSRSTGMREILLSPVTLATLSTSLRMRLIGQPGAKTTSPRKDHGCMASAAERMALKKPSSVPFSTGLPQNLADCVAARRRRRGRRRTQERNPDHGIAREQLRYRRDHRYRVRGGSMPAGNRISDASARRRRRRSKQIRGRDHVAGRGACLSRQHAADQALSSHLHSRRRPSPKRRRN